MSLLVDGSPNPSPPSPRRRRSGSFYLWSWLGGTVAACVLLASYWLPGCSGTLPPRSSPTLCRSHVVGALEDATGGRVELGAFHWSLRHLASRSGQSYDSWPGRSGRGAVCACRRLYVRARILAFFRPEIALNYLEADHPVLHLIVYPDGSTNQPRRARKPAAIAR